MYSYALHNLNLRLQTKPVTVGADAVFVYIYIMYNVIGVYVEILIIFGTVQVSNLFSSVHIVPIYS